MTKEDIQALLGQHVRLTAQYIDRHAVLTDIRPREGGLPIEFWVDFSDGYSILATAPGFKLEPYVEEEQLENEVTYVKHG